MKTKFDAKSKSDISLLQKITKRLHLSKMKLSKFNESSQLAVFYISSAIWGIDIVVR